MAAPLQLQERLNTVKYQHAVAFSGHQLLHLVMRTLIRGDISNIIALVKDKLRTNTEFKNSFTKEEQEILATVPHEKWDITLLFKVIQKVCGLEKAGNTCWTQPTSSNECLEYLITMLKDERNKIYHNFLLVLQEDELERRLNDLTTLALKLTSALVVRASLLGKQLSDGEPDKTIQLVLDIIEDAKGKINEDPPVAEPPPAVVPESFEDEDLQGDGIHIGSAFVAAGVGGQAFQGVGRRLSQQPSLEDEIERLTWKIWEYAGPQDVIV